MKHRKINWLRLWIIGALMVLALVVVVHASDEVFGSTDLTTTGDISGDELDANEITVGDGTTIDAWFCDKIEIGTANGDATRITYYNDLIESGVSIITYSVDTLLTAGIMITLKDDSLIMQPAVADTSALKGKTANIQGVNPK